ncbi:F0F1 ATP synthase subunit B [Yinghuangia seranimata]|uniref:F0F1 ATP synthase subunit B n=1 Tax=Yinghuangia seranimata TaxID=408067 RepID=UPI00248C92BC|nr:F0F1 ATP synthase subunit B [Yinghuangia seranimata]MDI2128165.1 F0F1 ATP synthase subunit B [Yinghuangia seranimata]
MIYLASETEQNPLLPPLDEIIIGGVAFLIVFFFLGKVLLPKIQKTLADRTDAIEGGLKRAEDAQAEAQAELERYRAQLIDARREAGRLTEDAREQGAAAIAEMRAEGARIKDEIVASGHAQIEDDRKQASSVLRRDVGKLAVDLASRIVGESLEDEARQRRIVDRFLEELEAKAAAQTPEQVR